MIVRASILAAGAVSAACSRQSHLVPTTAAATAAAKTETATEAATTSRRVQVICKEAWGGEPARGSFSAHTIQRLTVHHSAEVLRRNRQAPDQLRAIQRYHQDQGWPDIAYHFIIDRHGNVYKGRPTWARPDTFTDYNPRGHLAVMCLGNFNEQLSPWPQVAALRDVLAWAVREFDVTARGIKGHRDYTATACPGADLYRLIESRKLHRLVRRRLDRGGARLDRLCGDQGRRRVRAIERGDD